LINFKKLKKVFEARNALIFYAFIIVIN
jgi:hypothetical protein